MIKLVLLQPTRDGKQNPYVVEYISKQYNGKDITKIDFPTPPTLPPLLNNLVNSTLQTLQTHSPSPLYPPPPLYPPYPVTGLSSNKLLKY